MRRFAVTVTLFLAVFLLAVTLRFDGLGEKPLHTDEAVQAYKLGQLLAGDGYVYDPADHHGPVLYYAAAITARLAGEKSFVELTAPVLRVTPALFGVALVFVPLLWIFCIGGGTHLACCRRHPAVDLSGKSETGVRQDAEHDTQDACPPHSGFCKNVLLVAAFLGAASPMAVYYARYFIQETILVTCFWAAVPLWWRLCFGKNDSPSLRWMLVVTSGVLFGVAISAKETWVLMFAAVVTALLISSLLDFANKSPASAVAQQTPASGGARILRAALGILPSAWVTRDHPKTVTSNSASLELTAGCRQQHARCVSPPRQEFCVFRPMQKNCVWLFASVTVALLVAAVFYSSFGKNPQGITDAISAYGGYFQKTSGGPHDKPFGWYAVNFFGIFNLGKTAFLMETVTAGLCLVTLGALTVKKIWPPRERRIAAFSLLAGAILFFVYSLIHYKTPWLLLGVLPPLWLAAAFGAVMAWRHLRRLWKFFPLLGAPLVCVAAFFMVNDCRQVTRRLAADERNPLAYVHTSEDVFRAESWAKRLATVTPPTDFRVNVITDEYWPLPWYLRHFKSRYWVTVPDASESLDAPMVITDAATDDAVTARLRDNYVTDFLGLRPGVILTVRMREDLLKISRTKQEGNSHE